MSSEINQNRAGSPSAADRTAEAGQLGGAQAGTAELERNRQGPGMAASGATGVALRTELGTTSISDSVVAKIAGLACRDIPGVFSMGTGMARRVGQIRSLMPGGGESAAAGQGVSVEVGEREAAIDLDIVTWYGQSIVEVSEAVRRNVAGQVEGMTGLHVVEVNINVDDIHVES
ncbi:MAG TPA: Asp23/Gls24 family envelope stress response protein, partial [Micromonosporaceae bacterium]